MWTETTEGQRYVEDVSKFIVAEVAPGELDLFDELTKYYEDRSPPDRAETAGDDSLAFGLAEVIVPVTPAALALVIAVLNYIFAETTAALEDRGEGWLKERLGQIFPSEDKDRTETREREPYTNEQLKQIRRIARREARRFGMESDMANKMADVLIGRLALDSLGKA
jgi:hypothetical protein